MIHYFGIGSDPHHPEQVLWSTARNVVAVQRKSMLRRGPAQIGELRSIRLDQLEGYPWPDAPTPSDVELTRNAEAFARAGNTSVAYAESLLRRIHHEAALLAEPVEPPVREALLKTDAAWA